jgi:hypothetical protein
MEAKMYTYLITFEIYLDCYGLWTGGHFRTTDDAVEMHRKVLAERTAKGEIRNAEIVRMEAENA